MVNYCIAYNCKKEHYKGINVHFHSFPLNRPEILKKWLIAIRRLNWSPTKHSRICSAHFIESDYLPGSKNMLKLDAVPSVFDFPKHLIKEIKTRRILQRKEITLLQDESKKDIENQKGLTNDAANKSICDTVKENGLTTKDTTTEIMHDVGEENGSKTHDVAIQTTRDVAAEINSLRRKVKTLNQYVTRNEKRIQSLKKCIKELKSNRNTNEKSKVYISKNIKINKPKQSEIQKLKKLITNKNIKVLIVDDAES